LAALAAAILVTWLSLAGPIGPATASSDRAVGAPVTAWWTNANVGRGVAVPGTLLGASGKQLPVEGSNALPAVAAVSSAPLSSLAVAGVRWHLPQGAVPASLSFALAATPPPFVTVQACRATATFAAVYGGPYADVPSYSCTGAVDGVLKNGRLTFPGIGKLATAGTLSVLLLPGPLDRVVLAPPSASSLVLAATPAQSQRSAAVTAASTTGRGAGTESRPSTPAGGASSPGPLPSVPPASQGGPSVSAPAPIVAGSSSSGLGRVAASEVLPRWRRYLALSVIALEIAVVMVLLRRPGGREAKPARGIGRFVADREAPPIHL
jgi:hypothetical protein